MGGCNCSDFAGKSLVFWIWEDAMGGGHSEEVVSHGGLTLFTLKWTTVLVKTRATPTLIFFLIKEPTSKESPPRTNLKFL